MSLPSAARSNSGAANFGLAARLGHASHATSRAAFSGRKTTPRPEQAGADRLRTTRHGPITARERYRPERFRPPGPAVARLSPGKATTALGPDVSRPPR